MGKGFKQGEPLSLYLFNLVSEALVRMFRNIESQRFIEAIEVKKRAKVKVKYLQFFDDTLIFVPRNTDVYRNYFRILDVFSVMSRLHLNYHKSNLI